MAFHSTALPETELQILGSSLPSKPWAHGSPFNDPPTKQAYTLLASGLERDQGSSQRLESLVSEDLNIPAVIAVAPDHFPRGHAENLELPSGIYRGSPAAHTQRQDSALDDHDTALLNEPASVTGFQDQLPGVLIQNPAAQGVAARPRFESAMEEHEAHFSGWQQSSKRHTEKEGVEHTDYACIDLPVSCNSGANTEGSGGVREGGAWGDPDVMLSAKRRQGVDA